VLGQIIVRFRKAEIGQPELLVVTPHVSPSCPFRRPG
jgi:hypothetical protein